MTKKIITFIFILVLFNSNHVLNAQGPNAPEAASFEPVDATDMVNLLTGDMTYVMPLLNVPGPEGGYPVTLSYHAGIGKEQEASWVGLGWSLNPGTINRGVNGYPDDWKNGNIDESFFDVGGEETIHSLSLSYTTPGGSSIAASISHNSNRGFGGSISLSQGIPYFNGIMNKVGDFSIGGSIGVLPGGNFYGGVNGGFRSTNSNHSFSFSSDTLGNSGLNIGYNGASLGVSTNGYSLNYSRYVGSVGISMNHDGDVSLSVGLSGIGKNISFANSVNANDYNVETNQNTYGLTIPVPKVGAFSIGYSRRKVKWYLNSQKQSSVSGAFYFGDALKYACEVTLAQSAPGLPYSTSTSIRYVDTPSECSCTSFNSSQYYTCLSANLVDDNPNNTGKYFMDVNEIGITDGSFSLDDNNAIYAAYDSYSVSAQGIGGQLSPQITKTGALLGLAKDFNDGESYNISYDLGRYSGFQNNYSNTGYGINFAFDNQHSSSFTIDPGSFTSNPNATSPYDYHLNNSGTNFENRKRDSRVVQHYTLKDLRGPSYVYADLVLPENFDFSESEAYEQPNVNLPESAIVAFKITASDGKTYHYSLPVVNKKTNVRVIGAVENKPERESYFETRQGSYVTHWLLTAITGPDYVEGNGGSIIRFEYGKWTDNDVWKLPYDEDYEISEENDDNKTITHGVKEIYYLDRIKTRTHTAIFVKNIRNDEDSFEWERHELGGNPPSSATFDEIKWTIPKQKPLRLDKIILVKNENDFINKSSGTNLANTGTIFPPLAGDIKPDYNIHKNVVDIYDNIEQTMNKAIKIIDFSQHYDYKLVKSAPNSPNGKLTLNGLSFLGKGGENIIPTYKFTYNNNPIFDKDNFDVWGNVKNNPAAWSLNSITDPVGSRINFAYESDDYSLAAAETRREFNKHLKFTFFEDYFPSSNNIEETIRLKVEVDDLSPYTDNFQLSDYFDPTKPFDIDMWLSTVTYQYPTIVSTGMNIKPQQASIISLDITNNSMIIEVVAIKSGSWQNSTHSFFQANPFSAYTASNGYETNQKKNRPLLAVFNGGENYSLIFSIISNKRPDPKVGGGIRVKEINVSQLNQNYSTRYYYNKPNTDDNPLNIGYISSGVISYQPFERKSSQTIAYGSLLPSPIPTYEYVTVKNNYLSSNNSFTNKTTYKFKVLEKKDINQIKFGNLFSVSESLELEAINGSNTVVNAKRYEIKDNLSCLGQILDIESYNNKNQLLFKTSNMYLEPQEISQGIVKEAFESYKQVDYENNNIPDKWYLNVSIKTSYPSVLRSTKSIDNSGYVSETTFARHDELTGKPIEIITQDSKGNNIKTETVPAYTIPEYGSGNYSMGPKLNNLGTYNSTNKNMLTQEAMTKTYIEVNGEWKVSGVGITTWNNNWEYYSNIASTPTENPISKKIWRRHKTFIWDGDINEDGTYQSFNGGDDGFNWGVAAAGEETIQTNPNWKNISTFTIYDKGTGLPLEIKDINNNYVSTKVNQVGNILSSSNSGLSEQFYSDAESLSGGLYSSSFYGGYIYPTVENLSALFYHTGSYSTISTVGAKTFKSFPKPKFNTANSSSEKYKISVWVHKNNGFTNNVYSNSRLYNGQQLVSFNGETVFAGDWVQLNHYLDLSQQTEIYVTTIDGVLYFDDFRIHPISSSMASYVYNEWDELEAILGANNLATKFEYDSQGRLIRTYTEMIDTPEILGGFKISTENDYHYKNQ